MPKPPSRKPSSRKPSVAPKPGLHPRNPHRARYDFAKLIAALPALEPFLKTGPRGDQTIDFADAEAVKVLNRALLAQFYGVLHWDIPEGYLCPPIPGRADYIHHIADLLAEAHGGKVPGAKVRALDIGTGANLVYPIVGSQSYDWSFVGVDIDRCAMQSAATLVEQNAVLKGKVELRHQPDKAQIFHGIIQPGEQFDITLCNPPFHASAKDAAAGTERKLKNLAANRAQRGQEAVKADRLNFGGQNNELWCPGGEAAFVGRMIEQSRDFASQVCWFSSLVSSSRNMPDLEKALKKAGVADVRVLEMSQGQKQSRVLAWSFLGAKERTFWAQYRWR